MIYGSDERPTVQVVTYITARERERLIELARREDRKVAALLRREIRALLDREVPEQ